MEVEADHLYHESVQLVRTYTDSMRIARDSATVNRVDKSFEGELTRLNYKYSPEAYLGISQGQNDTLTRLTIRFVELRDSLLHRIAHPIVLVTTDSIAADSLATSTPSPSTL